MIKHSPDKALKDVLDDEMRLRDNQQQGHVGVAELSIKHNINQRQIKRILN